MKKSRIQKWAVGLGFVGGVLVLLIVGGQIGWQTLLKYFMREYYQENYLPIALSDNTIGNYPSEHHLNDVPWISTRELLCQSTALQMIADQQGNDKPRRHFDFLMGFTYGATSDPNGLGFYPWTDPETGFVAAAPYLGLVRSFYVTDDEALYLKTLRYYLSLGYSLRVGLNFNTLYANEGSFPHNEVLVGYDGKGFYYYEPLCIDPAPCEPGRWEVGERGLYVTDQRLLDAVLTHARTFQYPWRYSLSVFEEGEQDQDLRPIWTRNGHSLIGGTQYGPKQGADVIEGLAVQIEQRGVYEDISDIQSGLETAVYVRHENAKYLREAFVGEADIERAAELLDRAARAYQAVLDAIKDGIIDQAEASQIATWLRDAATAEREAGKIFLIRGQ